jgi:hypothetical protein
MITHEALQSASRRWRSIDGNGIVCNDERDQPSLGVIMLDTSFERPPDDVGNARTNERRFEQTNA